MGPSDTLIYAQSSTPSRTRRLTAFGSPPERTKRPYSTAERWLCTPTGPGLARPGGWKPSFVRGQFEQLAEQSFRAAHDSFSEGRSGHRCLVGSRIVLRNLHESPGLVIR